MLKDKGFFELKKLAKEKGINTYGLKREELEDAIRKYKEPVVGAEEPTSTEENKPVQYVSVKSTRLRIVMKSSFFKYFEGGSAQRIEGRSIQFENGIFATSDPDEINFLDGHPANKANPGGSTEFIRMKKTVTESELRQKFTDMSKSLEDKELEIERLRAQLVEKEMKEKGQIVPDHPKQEVTTGVRGSESIHPKF